MNIVSVDVTVGEFVTQRPSRSRVFEKWGIDYCCGGKKPLAQACQEKGLDPQRVLRELEHVGANVSNEERDWRAAGISELCDNIETTHHAYLKAELPRLEVLVRKIAAVHGERHPELYRLAEVFSGFKQELVSHMAKEEEQLFPAFRAIEFAGSALGQEKSSVPPSIHELEDEHASAGRAMEEMSLLTDGYRPPADACNTYRAALARLSELQVDMHRHVHKENSILFPMVVELAPAAAR